MNVFINDTFLHTTVLEHTGNPYYFTNMALLKQVKASTVSLLCWHKTHKMANTIQTIGINRVPFVDKTRSETCANLDMALDF